MQFSERLSDAAPRRMRHDKDGDTTCRSRRATRARVLHLLVPVDNRGRREGRVSAAPMAPCAADAQRNAHGSNHRYSRVHSGLPCAVVYGLLRALPGEPDFVVTVIRAMRLRIFRDLAPALGRQDHTTSPSTKEPFVFRLPRVHRIPHSTSVTTRTSLLPRRNARRMRLIWVKRKAIYFLREIWTTQIRLKELTKLAFARIAFSGPCRTHEQQPHARTR